MEMDLIEEQAFQQPSQVAPKRRIMRPVDDVHPFDLDAYIMPYTGRAAVDRLIAIISTCPSIACQALQLAFSYIKCLRDPSLCAAVVSAYEGAASTLEGASLPPVAEVAVVDAQWMDGVTKQNAIERVKLEVELKTYTSNMIKESIRMAHRDLGDFFRSTGDFSLALKHYSKSREFCSTSQHVLDMYLSVLELTVEHRHYVHILSHVYKAEGALESVMASAATAAQSNTITQGSLPPQGQKLIAERDQIQTKLDFALALSHLGQGSYEKAASALLKLGPVEQLGNWIGQLIAPGDIAIYGTLCALASLPRSAISKQILGSPIFSTYIEHEPYVRDLLQAYISSDFKSVLELLSKYSTRHYIDVHLSQHVNELTRLIRSVAVVLYFTPFQTIRLQRMAAAFGLTVEELEKEVVTLIQSGKIMGRVDSQNKILVARKTDPRAELFFRAIKKEAELESTNRKLLLRMRLQEADLVVRDPKKREQERALEAALGEMS